MGTSVTHAHGYCLKCQARCGVIAEVVDGTLRAVIRDDEHPNGGICAMGAAAPEIASSPKRLTAPLRRVNDKNGPPEWKEISWDEALDELVERMQETRAAYGAEAVAFSRPTTSANASADWAPYLVRLANLFGTPNIHTASYLCQWNRDDGLAHTYGVGLPTPDIEHSDVVLLFGHNPAVTNPHLFRRLAEARKRGARIVVVDPRESETTRLSSLWLAPRYGTDGALVLGAVRALLERRAFDAEFVRDWTNAPFLVDLATGRLVRKGREYGVVDQAGGLSFVDSTVPPDSWTCEPQLDAVTATASGGAAATVFHLLRDCVAPYTVAHTGDVTGIPTSQLEAFYELIASRPRLSYYAWNGWEQHANSYATHRAMAALYALTGLFDAPGGNVIFPPVERIDVEGDAYLEPTQAAKRLGLQDKPLGASNRSTSANYLYRAILDEDPYPVRMLVSFGSNMLLQSPDSDRGREALRKLAFHAHVDVFETPMALSADMLLPAATLWEAPGLRMGFGGGTATAFHLQYRPPAVSPPAAARPDLEIIFELAQRLGYGEAFWSGDVTAAFNARLAPHGLSVQDLIVSPRGVTVESRLRYRKYRDIDPATGRVAGFKTESGKLEIYSERLLDHGYQPMPVYVPPSTTPSGAGVDREKYPLVLSSVKLRVTVHSQDRGTPSLRKRWPEPFVEVHPATAQAYAITEGDRIRVETPHAAMTATARFSTRVREGVVIGHAGWWEDCPELDLPGYDPFSDDGANFNRLIPGDAVDDVSGAGAVKSYHCRIRRLPGN